MSEVSTNQGKQPITMEQIHAEIQRGFELSIQGDFPAAERQIRRAYRHSASIGYDRGKARSLGTLGVLYAEKQDFYPAVNAFQQASQFTNEDENFYISLVGNWGSALSNIGRHQESLNMLERAKFLCEKRHLTQTDQYANIIGNIASVLFTLHRFNEADRAAMTAIELIDQKPELAASCLRVIYITAYHHIASGEFEKSMFFSKKYLDYVTDYTKDPVPYVTCLAFSALSKLKVGELAEGERESQVFFDFYHQLPGALQINTALVNLYGHLLFQMGRNDEVIQYYRKSLQLLNKIGKTTDLGGIYNNIGVSLLETKTYDEAHRYLVQSLKSMKKWRTPYAWSYSSALVTIGYCNFLRKLPVKSSQAYFFNGMAQQNQILKMLSLSSTESRLSSHKSICFPNVQMMLQYLASAPLTQASLLKGYCLLEFSKNLAFTSSRVDWSMHSQSHARSEANHTIQLKYKELEKISEQCSAFALGKSADKLGDWSELVKQYESITTEIARFQSDRSEQTQFSEMTPAQIRSGIKKATVFIDYYYSMSSNDQSIPAAYVAFVMYRTPDNRFHIRSVILKESKTIDEATAVLMKPASGYDENWYQNWLKHSQLLYQKLIEPIVAVLESENVLPARLIISPDAGLSRLQFEQLTDNQGKLLVENYQISYTISASMLFSTPHAKSHHHGDSVIVANPQYTVRSSQSAVEPVPINSRQSWIHDALHAITSEISFDELPGSEDEGVWVESVLKKRSKGKIYRYSGPGASKYNFFRHNSPKILHIATHGFFIPESTLKSSMESILDPRPLRVSPEFMLSSGARNGIVLAGVNDWLRTGSSSPKHKTGIVTAGEIEHSSNLSGTQLVFLSGCNTGLGQERILESPVGLIRSISKAGAQSVIAALQPIPDVINFAGIQHFYRYLADGNTISDALTRMQRELIASARTMTGVAHPSLWAGFVLYGNDSRIEG